MEKWLPIKDFPNYEVSNHGSVRNVLTKHILRPWLVSGGYQVVSLRNDSGKMKHYIHRLVADAFLDGNHYGLEVNHKDGCKINNFIDNLEWCTRKENARHAVRTGLLTPYKLPVNPHPSKKVKIVETGEIFDSITACAEHIGGFKTAISACLHGKVHTHKGYHFEEI